MSLQGVGCRRQIDLAAVDAFLRPVPSPDMAVGTRCDDAILFKTEPAHRVVIDDFGLANCALALGERLGKAGRIKNPP